MECVLGQIQGACQIELRAGVFVEHVIEMGPICPAFLF